MKTKYFDIATDDVLKQIRFFMAGEFSDEEMPAVNIRAATEILLKQNEFIRDNDTIIELAEALGLEEI